MRGRSITLHVRVRTEVVLMGADGGGIGCKGRLRAVRFVPEAGLVVMMMMTTVVMVRSLSFLGGLAGRTIAIIFRRRR
jgi:hypothetical protein